jgi:hypothetical protein
MATEHTGGSEAVLALARELRRAIADRQALMQGALHAYDHASGDRYEHATKFIRVIERADTAYESSLQEALERFRERIEEVYGR